MSENKQKYNGLPRATYYRRIKEWTLELFDKDGNAYHASPKHVMKKDQELERLKLEEQFNSECG